MEHLERTIVEARSRLGQIRDDAKIALNVVDILHECRRPTGLPAGRLLRTGRMGLYTTTRESLSKTQHWELARSRGSLFHRFVPPLRRVRLGPLGHEVGRQCQVEHQVDGVIPSVPDAVDGVLSRMAAQVGSFGGGAELVTGPVSGL